MFWHAQYLAKDHVEVYDEAWHQGSEEQLMGEYFARHKDQDPEAELEELRQTIAFNCVDPRLAIRVRAQCQNFSAKAERKFTDDWANLDKVFAEYIEQHYKLPYCSVLQALATMIGPATQERRRNYDRKSAPARVEQFMSPSLTDLMLLQEKLFKITTENYTEKLAKETDRGDCCMMSGIEWGHARNDIHEHVADFDDED
eukprot:s47_g40.t1